MGRWSKKALPTAELLGLGLTPEEGFVLSRLDVALDPAEVVALTGLPLDRVTEILGNLGSKGAIGSDDPADLPSRPPPDLAEPEQETTQGEPDHVLDAELEEFQASGGDEGALDEGGAEPDPAAEEDEPLEDTHAEDANYRRIYETELRKLERDERLGIAHRGGGPRLVALCYDPDPAVILAVLDNPQSNLLHARAIARHHGTSAGLEHIVKRAPLLADHQLQHGLLRNPQLTEVHAKRVLSPKRMVDVYKATVNPDIPERTRAFARGVLRSKFGTSQGEERAGLISTTEGRVLMVLTGLTLDGRATSILCARAYTSVLFVQNLARWGACPPPLLAHLLKQPLVRRQQHLKNMILRHPNVPSDAKKRI